MTQSIDQQFIEFVVKSLVSNPDAVQIDRRIDEKGVLLELSVDPEDLGRVIGKRGATAQSLRTLLRALGTKNEARYNLKIVDNGVPAPAKPAKNSDDDNDAVAAASDDDSDASDDNELPEPDKATEDEQKAPESDLASKTRKELQDLDDLEI